MKSQVKAKATWNLDMLVHRSESPFTKRVDDYPLPTKFKVPQLENFDGLRDPLDYLDSFRTVMRLQGVLDEIMCRAFPTNLRGSMIWIFQKQVFQVRYSKTNRKNVGSSSRQDGRPKSFTPLNMSIDQVLLQVQDNPALKWPRKLRSSPAQRSKDLYCRFH